MASGARPQLPSRAATVSRDHVPRRPSGLRREAGSQTDPALAAPASSVLAAAGDSSRGGAGGPSSHYSYNNNNNNNNNSNNSATAATESTSLLRGVLDLREDRVHDGPCNHGTFSPRASSPVASGWSSMADDVPSGSDSEGSQRAGGGLLGGGGGGEGGGGGGGGGRRRGSRSGKRDWKRRWAARMKSKKMSKSSALAQRHGVQDSAFMYLAYYLPVLVWARKYKWSYLKGDFVAALTVAGMYVPMALSLADNLAHVPPLHGLYAFVVHPFVYALLGSCPAMVVGPEAAGSLLVGSVVQASVDRGRGADDDDALHARICGVVTGIAGATVLAAGLARLGFLDSVLSRPFLRGFISAVGFVIFVDQLVPELGLSRLEAHTPAVGHGSSVDKLAFIVAHLDRVHALTCALAATSFVVILLFRELKRRLQPRYPPVAFLPDRFLVVVLATCLAAYFRWDERGVAVLGPVQAAAGRVFAFRWPFRAANLRYIRDATETAFLIALLGFFESSVAAKGLGAAPAFSDVQLSPNRELVALGAANLLGACFMSLPAFGGYGRSKVNKATGGVSPMSSVFLSLLTLVCILFLLPYFYYLPKPVLSSMISVVAWSLIEECPADIAFFVRIRAWPELGLMLVIVLATIFYSLTLGIAIGVGLSLLQVVRHATRPRIQILGRIPGTQRFENAEADPGRLEFVEGCLIVKIPEPLTFANTGELKTRLRRLELYGTSQAHPALPRLRREEANRNAVFDIHGVTSLDGSGAQVLAEIVRGYRQRGVHVFFSRGPRKGHPVWERMERAGIVEAVGGESHFVDDVEEALKLTEMEEGAELSVRTEDTSLFR